MVHHISWYQSEAFDLGAMLRDNRQENRRPQLAQPVTPGPRPKASAANVVTPPASCYGCFIVCGLNTWLKLVAVQHPVRSQLHLCKITPRSTSWYHDRLCSQVTDGSQVSVGSNHDRLLLLGIPCQKPPLSQLIHHFSSFWNGGFCKLLQIDVVSI